MVHYHFVIEVYGFKFFFSRVLKMYAEFQMDFCSIFCHLGVSGFFQPRCKITWCVQVVFVILNCPCGSMGDVLIISESLNICTI